MSDPVWYYARGETRKGALSTAQMKALAAAGKIRPDDLVWKEGLENWLPAGEIPELFPVEAGKVKERGKGTEAGEAEGATTGVSSAVGWKLPSLHTATERSRLRLASRVVVVSSLLILLTARGCDELGRRYVARLQARPMAAEQAFRIGFDEQEKKLGDQLAARRSSPAAGQGATVESLQRQITELQQKRDAEESRLRQSAWKEWTTAAELAEAENTMWAFWRGLAFLLATLTLTGGLIALAYASDGPERWVCLVALAIQIHGLYGGLFPEP
jgi:hypothetical protein